jgi:hypothetical protein
VDTNLIILSIIFIFLAGIFIIQTKPEYLVYFLAIDIFFMDWFTEELGVFPHSFTFIVEIILILFSLFYFAKISFNGKIRNNNLISLFLIIWTFCIAGNFVNNNSLSDFILGFRHFFKWPLFFLILSNFRLGTSFYIKLIYIIMGLIMIQPLLGLFQFFILNHTDDKIFGSVRSNTILSVLFMWFLIINFQEFYKFSKIIKVVSIFNLIMIIFICALGEAKGFFIFLPLVLIINYYKSFSFYKISNLIFLGSLTIIFIYFVNYMERLHGFDFASLLDINIDPTFVLDAMKYRGDVAEAGETLLTSSLIRVGGVYLTFQYLFQSLSYAIFGGGLGEFTLTYGELWSTIDSEYRIMHYVSFGQLAGSIGYVGLFLYLFIIYKIYNVSKKISNKEEIRILKSLFKSFGTINIIFLISFIYGDHFHDITGFVYWSFVLILYERERYFKGKINYAI